MEASFPLSRNGVWQLARNIPNTTSCACWASSLVIWFTLPYMKFCCYCGLFWFLAPGSAYPVGHYHAKWPVNPHLKQALPLRLPWAGAFCEVGAVGRGPCCTFWWDGCCTLGRWACGWGFCIWKFGRCDKKFGRCIWNGGRCACIDGRTILRFLKKGPDWGKRGQVSLSKDYPENDDFLLPFFSISLILFSTMIALSTIFWKSS
jgi:hypothetical protein